MTVIFVLILAFSSVLVNSERVKRQVSANRCYTPDNYPGLCVPLPNCPILLEIYASNGGSRQSIRYLKLSQRNCGNVIYGGEPVVCCSQPVTNVRYQEPPEQTEPPFEPNPNNPFLPVRGQSPRTQPPTTIKTTPNPPTWITTQKLSTTRSSTTSFFIPTTSEPTTTKSSTTSKYGQGDSKKCFGPDAKQGYCKSLADCPPLLSRLKKNPEDQSLAKFLRLSNTICEEAPPIICCPTESESSQNPPVFTLPTINPVQTIEPRLLSPEEGCGQTKVSHTKIVGGTDAKPGTWPWLALLGYEDDSGVVFRCGGSLVTKRHVVTAAHCIRKNLRLIRLGEYDLDNSTDTKRMDVKYIRTVANPRYNSRIGHSDIAIIYLAQDIKFNEFIRPICIPDKITFESRSLIGYTPFVAGWGRTKEDGNSSSILQETQLPILSNEECKRRYYDQNRFFAENQFDDAIICAGYLNGGIDTCQGDSGGPLMLPERLTGGRGFYFNMIGVVSYGIGCARAEIPGVYASVAHFSDWIKEKIAEPI